MKYYGNQPIKDQKEIDMIFSLYESHNIIHQQDMLKLKTYLTPPTSDEVCNELSKYFDANIIYEWGTMTFKFDIDWIEISKLTIEKRVDVTMLPPHLITLIGRFYEGVVK